MKLAAALLMLVCTEGYRITLTETGAILEYDGFSLPMPRRTDGDCARRKTDCFQSGQMMVNIAKDGRVWVNTDVDDNTEHRSIGELVRCKWSAR